MGDPDAARDDKRASYAELDDPDAAPIGAPYSDSASVTEHVGLDELQPVDEPAPGWEEGVGVTEHLSVTDLEPAESWDSKPIQTEAVELDELVVLERLDPKDANPPPPLPDVGVRSTAPKAPLPIRRPTGRPPAAKASSPPKPRSAPPPPPPPADRKPPMIGSEGWEPEGRVSVVDFSAVLSSPPPARRAAEATEKVELGPPRTGPGFPVPATAPEPAEGSSAVRWFAIGVLVLAVGAGAYFLGRRGAPVAVVDGAGDDVADEPMLDEPMLDEPETVAPLQEPDLEEPEALSNEPVEEPAVEEPPAVVTMRAPTAMREPSAMRAVPVDEPREPATMAEPTMDPEPEVAMAATPMAAAPELPARPDREDVQRALASVRPAVAACLEGQHATVRVRVTVRGSGRVTTAQVEDSFWARPPHGSCIARAVRGARFPEFSDDSFVVLYPFTI